MSVEPIPATILSETEYNGQKYFPGDVLISNKEHDIQYPKEYSNSKLEAGGKMGVSQIQFWEGFHPPVRIFLKLSNSINPTVYSYTEEFCFENFKVKSRDNDSGSGLSNFIQRAIHFKDAVELVQWLLGLFFIQKVTDYLTVFIQNLIEE